MKGIIWISIYYLIQQALTNDTFDEPLIAPPENNIHQRVIQSKDGDNFIVNGQKVWTSYADECDMIFTLVRTGPQEPKHNGISFLLIDMDQPGVETKPIKLISGKSPFCETFFTDAVVPKANLVHDLNKGWDGTYNNHPSPIGGYVYQLKIEGLITKAGTVTLIR